MIEKQQIVDEKEKLREELLDGELADDLYEYVLGTSDYVCEMVGQEANNTVDDCKTIEQLKELREAVLDYKKEQQKLKEPEKESGIFVILEKAWAGESDFYPQLAVNIEGKIIKFSTRKEAEEYAKELQDGEIIRIE